MKANDLHGRKKIKLPPLQVKLHLFYGGTVMKIDRKIVGLAAVSILGALLPLLNSTNRALSGVKVPA